MQMTDEKLKTLSLGTSNSTKWYEILLKFNLDQNDFVTYRKEAGLTFKIIMLNSFRLILPHDELT